MLTTWLQAPWGSLETVTETRKPTVVRGGRLAMTVLGPGVEGTATKVFPSSVHSQLYTLLRPVTQLAARSKAGEALFPVAWGIGWRGMTGATLERLDGPSARTADANADDPALLRAARGNHPMMEGRRGVPVFPKSRRLASDGTEPALPLGWVGGQDWQLAWPPRTG